MFSKTLIQSICVFEKFSSFYPISNANFKFSEFKFQFVSLFKIPPPFLGLSPYLPLDTWPIPLLLLAHLASSPPSFPWPAKPPRAPSTPAPCLRQRPASTPWSPLLLPLCPIVSALSLPPPALARPSRRRAHLPTRLPSARYITHARLRCILSPCRPLRAPALALPYPGRVPCVSPPDVPSPTYP